MARFEKGCFPGGRRKALTFSFDDGEQYDRRLAAMLRRYGLKATFYLVTGRFGAEIPHFRYGADTVVKLVTADELKETYRGMEVASHTAEHRAVLGELKSSVRDSMDYLQTLWSGEVTGMAFPGGEYTEAHIRELEALGVLYARTVHFTCSFALPDRLLEMHPTCHYGYEGIDGLIRSFCADDGGGENEKLKLFHIMGHSYELEQRDERYNWAAFEKICVHLSGRDDIWYATNGEIAAFLAARQRPNARAGHEQGTKVCKKHKAGLDDTMNFNIQYKRNRLRDQEIYGK